MMVKKILPILLVLLLVTAFAPAVQAQNTNPLADAIAKIDAVLAKLTDSDSFSGSVLIAKDEDVLLSKGYGLADREWDIPNTPQTKFRIGSLTKQFTAMGILLLQEQGKLTLQDSLCQYITNCPDAWKDITVFHLLTHTSGIPDFINLPDFSTTQRLNNTPEKLILSFKERKLQFKPGERWSYSNSNYLLLGYIISKVSGQSYPLFLRESIFKPLELHDTAYDFDSIVVKQRAQGYASATIKADFMDVSVKYAAGGLYSTVEDLHRWNQALFGGKVVKPETLDAMFKAAVSTGLPAPYDTYAFGLAVSNEQGHTIISHSGGVPGFLSLLAYLPDEKISIVILSNYERSSIGALKDIMLKMLLDLK